MGCLSAAATEEGRCCESGAAFLSWTSEPRAAGIRIGSVRVSSFLHRQAACTPEPSRQLSCLVLAALCVAGALGCGNPPGENQSPIAGEDLPGLSPPPSIVLISIDTLRSDRLPDFGYPGGRTPAISRLVRDGLVIEHAYSPVPLTLPAHASLFTGTLPETHGVRDNTGGGLGRELPTLAEGLATQGYATAGAVSAWVLRAETGIARGFERWFDDIEADQKEALGERERPAGVTLESVSPWLEERASTPGRPFFLFFHLYEPHDPYRPPEPWASSLADPYDGEVAAADDVVGRLLEQLDRLGLYEDALIVLTADHGEGLGDHGEERHGVLLYREAIQIPMVVKLPAGESSGTRVSGPVQLSDVAPFLLGRAGLAPRAEAFERAMAGDGESAPILGETLYPRLRFGWSELRSVVAEGHHLILGARPELYDLKRDPQERNDLSAERPETLARLLEVVEGYDVSFSPAGTVASDERDALLALGYLSATVDDDPSSERAHPTDMVHVLKALQNGIEALHEGRHALAIPQFESVLREAPRALDALQLLGLAYEQTAQMDRAIETYERAWRVAGERGPAAGRIARIESSRGRFEPSLPWLRAAQGAEPEETIYAVLETDALMRLQRGDEALAAAREHRARFPEDVDLLYQLAVVEMGMGLQSDAENHLRTTLEMAPEFLAALADLAILFTVQGRFDEARPVFQRALSLAPDDASLQANYRRFEEMEASGGAK